MVRGRMTGMKVLLGAVVQQPFASHADDRVAFAGCFAQAVDIPDLDLTPAVADETGLLKAVGHVETALRLTPIIWARNSWVSGKASLSHKSRARSSSRDSRD